MNSRRLNNNQEKQYQYEDKYQHSYTAAAPFILITANDVAQLAHARLQSATDAVSNIIHHLEHFPLLLEFSAHVVSLPSQVPDGLKHAIQVLILLMHNLHLLLLFELGVAIIPLGHGEAIRVREIAARAAAAGSSSVEFLLQLLAHVLHLAADFLNEALPPRDFVHRQAILLGV